MRAKEMIRVILLVSMFAPVLAMGAAGAVSVGDGALSIVNLRISPQPVVAGSNATIMLQLYNSYSSTLYNVNLQLTAQNPIINVSPSSTSIIDAIGTGLYGGGVGLDTFTYSVHIPSTLHAGEYTIDVVANYQTDQPNSYSGVTRLPASAEIPISFYVYGTPVIKLSANPSSMLSPGQSTSMQMSAVNPGTDVANNVTVTLHDSQYFKVFGTEQFNLGSISPDGTATFTANLQPSISISNGTYPVNATISYVAQSGNAVTENTSLLLDIIINQPNVVASIASATPTNLYAGGNQTLTVQLQNTGLGTAKNLTASFLNGPGVEIGSISQFFIASLGPKNSTTMTVYINANRSLSSNSFSLPVSLKYYSSNYNDNFTQLQYIPINIQKSAVFNITNVTTSIKPGDAYKPITFHIKNTGNIAAEQVTLSLQTTFPITPVNPNIYINSLAPGQSVNATFYVGVDPSGNLGNYPVTLFEQWRQPNAAVNQQFSGSNGYYAYVGTGRSGTSGYISYIEYAVVIAVIAFVAFRIYSSRKSQSKKKT
ncbi:MAG: COG1361 S-layer family protein [Candidatus Micrarchaeota archaeon]|nr:COG1361 S-layer family protein [Candidatus Micrarchaeota archaeon]